MSRRARVFVLVAAAVGLLFALDSAQAAGGPALSWSPITSSPPATFNFGAVSAAAGKSASQAFKVTNSGTSATSALKISVTGSSAFSKTADACTGMSLGPKKSCSVMVRYAPTRGGQIDTATLTANGSKSGVASASLALQGNGGTSVSCPGQRFVGPSDATVPALVAGVPDCHVAFSGGELFTAEASVEVPWSAGSTVANGTFDQAGQLVHFVDAAGEVTGFPPGTGGVLTATDPLGHSTSLSYDASGHLLAVGPTTLTYDAAGEVLKVTDRLGDTTDFTYDSSGNLVGVTDGSGTTSFTWDAAGQLLTLTNGSGTTTFTYDSSGELVSKHDPNGTTSFTWNATGYLLSTTDASGTTQFTYDSSGNPTSKHDASGTTSFTWDGSGDLLSATDPSGQTSSFVYNTSGDLISKTAPSGTTNFTYDSAGRLLSVSDPRGNTSNFTY